LAAERYSETLNEASYFSTRLRRIGAQLRYLPRALSLVWTAARRWNMAWVALLLVQAIRAGGSWDALRPVLLPAALIAGIMLLDQALRGVTVWVRTAQADLVQDYIDGLIHEKSLSVDLAFYESPEFYDHLHRARAEGGQRPVALVETLGSLLQNSITLAAMLAVLIPFGPWLPLALLGSTLPALYVVLRHALLQHQWRHRITADDRRAWYYDWLLTTGQPAAEMRLFALGGHSAQLSKRCGSRCAATGCAWPMRTAGQSSPREWPACW
jgi:ATP-binding cassette subfamily B protein